MSNTPSAEQIIQRLNIVYSNFNGRKTKVMRAMQLIEDIDVTDSVKYVYLKAQFDIIDEICCKLKDILDIKGL